MPTSSVNRAATKQWLYNALVANGGTITPLGAYRWIVENEPVPHRDIVTRTKRGNESVFRKEIRFARLDLVQEGILDDRAHWGVWTLRK